MNQRKRVSVSLASQVHHVPQIGFPQIGPVVSTTVVNSSPTSADASATRSARGSRSQRYTTEVTATTPKAMYALSAAGRCR